MTTVIEIDGRRFEVVPFGCRPGCRYCTHGEWRRLPWWTTAHFVADGLTACRSPMDVPAMVPAPTAAKCRTCMAVFARRMRGAAAGREQRDRSADRELAKATREQGRQKARAARAANAAVRAAQRTAAREAKAAEAARKAAGPPVFVGVDPLIDVIHRYERGEL